MGSSQSVENVSVTEVWTRLRADPTSVLIDVRTRAEWAFVGVPDLGGIGRKPVLIEWQSFPDSKVDPAFAERLSAILGQSGVGRGVQLFFICRSGGRSHMAAQVMSAAGWTRCTNVAEGFEGPLDSEGHRGSVAGWKVAGLPWTQG